MLCMYVCMYIRHWLVGWFFRCHLPCRMRRRDPSGPNIFQCGARRWLATCQSRVALAAFFLCRGLVLWLLRGTGHFDLGRESVVHCNCMPFSLPEIWYPMVWRRSALTSLPSARRSTWWPCESRCHVCCVLHVFSVQNLLPSNTQIVVLFQYNQTHGYPAIKDRRTHT